MGLRIKFLVLVFLFLGALLSFVYILNTTFQRSLLTDIYVDEGRDLMELFAGRFKKSLMKKKDLKLLAAMKEISLAKNVRYAFVLSPEGKVIAHSMVEEWGKLYRGKLTRASLNTRRFMVKRTASVYDLTLPLFDGTEKIGIFRLGLALGWVPKNMPRAVIVYSVGSAGVLFLTLCWIFFLVNYMVRNPLLRIQKIIESIRMGKWYETIEMKRKDEIGVLVREAFLPFVKKMKTIFDSARKKEEQGRTQTENITGGMFELLPGRSFLIIDSENKILHYSQSAREKLFPGKEPKGEHFFRVIKNSNLFDLIKEAVEHPGKLVGKQGSRALNVLQNGNSVAIVIILE